MSPLTFSYMVVAWFLFMLIFDRVNRASSTILFLSFSVNIIAIDLFEAFDAIGFIEAKYSLIMYDGAMALIMTMALNIDDKAKLHAKIICLTIICHIMISLYLITENEALEVISFLFYEYYEVLLIITATLHLLVSNDGMVRAINRYSDFIQSVSNRVYFYSQRIFKDLL